MHDRRTVTRRAAVACGLGALASLPAAALADTVSRLGYKADGTAYEGLVTVEGKTYLYEGGVKFTGGQKEYKGTRYFYKSDGHMAVSEKVTWDDGTEHRYGADGVLSDADELTGDAIAAGWYTLTRRESTRRLDVCGIGTENGTDVQLHAANDSAAQKWYVGWDAAAGAYKIESPAAVLEVRDYSNAAVGSDLQIWASCAKEDGSPYPHQRWRAMRQADGAVTFLNADTGLALGCAEDADGSHAKLQEVDYSDLQSWELAATDAASGWLTDAGGNYLYAGSDGRFVRGWQYLDGDWSYFHSATNGRAADGVDTVDGVKRYFRDRRLRASDDAVATCSSGVIGDWESGVTNAAWDFTDWDFVDEALNSARADDSDTDYYIYVKWQDPCRMVVCHRENNAWVAIGGWYCAVGRRRYSDWVPRGCAGTFTISQRWWRSNTGPGCAMDYIECYTGDGTPGAWNNDSASFHGNTGDTLGAYPGKWGYTTHSCIALTNARAEWMYNNVTLGTRMRNVGEMYGYGNGSDSNLRPAECYDIAIQNPFA